MQLLPLVAASLASGTLPWCAQREDRFLLSYDTQGHGLGHSLFNLRFMIRDALQWNRTLVLQGVIRMFNYNAGRKDERTPWAKYIGVDGVVASAPGQPPCRVRVLQLHDPRLMMYTAGLLLKQKRTVTCAQPAQMEPLDKVMVVTRGNCSLNVTSGILENNVALSPSAKRLEVVIPESPVAGRLARRLFESFPSGSWFAHVRRQNAVLECHYPCNVPGGALFLGEATTGEGLLPVFREHVAKGSMVFLATDEPHRSVFGPLAAEYDLKFEGDFRLRDGGARYPDPHDAYFTYAVTSRVWELFKQSSFHKVLTADRQGDEHADVEVCHTASKGNVRETALEAIEPPLLRAYYSTLDAAPLSHVCHEYGAAYLKSKYGAEHLKNGTPERV